MLSYAFAWFFFFSRSSEVAMAITGVECMAFGVVAMFDQHGKSQQRPKENTSRLAALR